MIERAVLDKWRAEAKSLEHPQAHPDVPRPGGYEASQRMLALIAEIDRLQGVQHGPLDAYTGFCPTCHRTG